jgi:FtsP/CotA-like multicopper oxidase with cupredoxin domain
MDGVPGVTQCDIQPGTSFTYNFTISADQSGTFWYHAHSNVQRADGLYGGFVIHRPVSSLVAHEHWDRDDATQHGYQKEILLLIGDWYHRQSRDVLSWYMRAGSFGNEVCPCVKLNPEAFTRLTRVTRVLAGSGFFDNQWSGTVQLLQCCPSTAIRLRRCQS